MTVRTIEAALKKFPEQLLTVPTVKNARALVSLPHTIVLGMGGSRLAADLLRVHTPTLPLIVHGDYGLPALPENTYTQSMVIACSFSGNTEEVLDGFERSLEAQLHVAVITSGGALLKRASEAGVPHVIVPQSVPQPRFGVGYFVRALLALIGSDATVKELQEFATTFNSEEKKEEGEQLAARLENRIPLIYTSTRNAPLGYNWKIRFNETAKIPAFANIIPEANHNELEGFDASGLTHQFYGLFLTDDRDDERVKERMQRTALTYNAHGVQTECIALEGKTSFEKIFSTVLFADWTSLALANLRGVQASNVPLIEEFKAQLRHVD